MPTFSTGAILSALSIMAMVSASAAAVDPLAPHRWRERVVVALSPAGDPDLVAQRRFFAAMAPGARERDLVLVEALDGTAEGAALRRRFGGIGFRAVLVGKDGGAKLTADRPLGPDDLFPLIDSMPMRQDEMQKAR